MKKLMAGLVVLVILGICSPSFGYLLLYRVSTTVKGADADTDAKVTIPLKGYLLLNLDDNNNIADANLILYGKDTDGDKKYVRLNYSDSADLLEADLWYVGNLVFVDIWGDWPFDFEIFLSGKTTLKNVGLGNDEKKSIAGSIKGVTIVWEDFLLGPSLDQDVSGTANASATLWTAATKAINGDDDEDIPWTQDEVVLELLDILTLKGFESATIPD